MRATGWSRSAASASATCRASGARSGPAARPATKVPLSITREAAPRELVLSSIDRRSFLKAPRLH